MSRRVKILVIGILCGILCVASFQFAKDYVKSQTAHHVEMFIFDDEGLK